MNQISLPDHDLYRGHDLQARLRYGDVVVARWTWEQHSGWWSDRDGAVLSFIEVVSLCMGVGWDLYSVPAEPAAPEHDTESDDGGN